MSDLDAIIIGTGQAGPTLADDLSDDGQSVAIVERDRVGGTCVNYGCTPTKTMVASARAAHVARRGEEFGVDIEGDVDVDMEAVHDRMRRISGASNKGVTRWLEGLEGVELIRGDAQLTGPRSVEVDGRSLEAEHIFIDSGARPWVPDITGLDEVDYLTNRGMLELTELPDHLVVVGGSYIGLEFGQMFRRFGSDVTIVEQGPRVVGRESEDISAEITEILGREGIELETGAKCFAVEPNDEGFAVRIDREGGAETVVGSHLLLATGRVPNTDSLGLEQAGVETDERGYIEVDDRLRTTVDGIWALGDCNGEGAFTHTSFNDYQIVADNLLEGRDRSVEDRVMCYGLFMDPPLARIGMGEPQARESDRDVLVGRMPMSRVSRARERSETDGLLKVFVDADTEQVLGATFLGIDGDEVIHSILTLMYTEASYRTMLDAVHIHPTVSELLPTLLDGLERLEG